MKNLKLKSLLRMTKNIMYFFNFSPIPFRIQADLTDRCNFLCPTCSKWKSKPGRELDTEEWKKILIKLQGKTITNRITFCGGEPFLRDDLLELVNSAKQFGFYITIITNGSLLNEKMLKELEVIGLDNLVISLNSINEQTHDSSRGIKGSYNHIMSILPRVHLYNIKVNLETIIMAPNINELAALADLVKQYNLYGISYQVLADVSAHYALVKAKMDDVPDSWYKDDQFWIREPKLVSNVINELIEKQNHGYPILNPKSQLKAMINYYANPESVNRMKCLSGISTLYLDPYGEIRLCYGFESIGNALDFDPIYLWRSKKAKKIRMEMKTCVKMCRLLNNNY